MRMKRIMIWILGCFVAFTATAQIVTVTVNGNRNQQVIINERIFDIENNTTNNVSKTFTINNLRPGEYTIQLVRINDANLNEDDIANNNNLPRTRTTTTFKVKEGFDVAIIIAANGIVQVREKQIAGTTSDARVALTDAAFRTILSDVEYHWRNTRKITAAQTAFTNNNNYFTAQQARQLIQSVAGEENRLTLVKLAYNRIVDPGNFIQVSNLILTPAGKDEMATFLRTQTTSSVITSYSDNFREPMSENNLNAHLESLERNWHAATRVNAVTTIIDNETNYFTTAQVRRLIEKVDFESNRLQLLKRVYTHVTDPQNFSLLYTLLATDAAKLELIDYVKTAAENGGLVNHNLNKSAVSEKEYTALVVKFREDLRKDNALNSLSEIFANPVNYFTTQQATQLISMVDGELTRLSLAKAAYRTIIDPENYISSMSQLLSSAVTVNELNIYAYSYRGVQ
jgi:hypothetical protein